MTNICGHDRDALTWALRLAYAMPRTAQDSYRPPSPTPDELAKICAMDAIHDPAKLAAIMAEEWRRLGFVVGDGFPSAADLHIFAIHDVAMIHVARNAYDLRTHKQLTTSQARAILLQWLRLPNGAREEAERVLRGSYVDPDELLNTIPIRERVEPRRFDPDPDRES